MTLCKRCGKEPAMLNVVGEAITDHGYCMECWLRGAYQLEQTLQTTHKNQTTTTRPLAVKLRPSARRQFFLIGIAVLSFVWLVALGLVGGEEVGAESLAPANGVGLSFLAVVGGLMIWIGDKNNGFAA